MFRSSSRHGFTLIEMLTVMLIIAILAGLVLAINGLVQNKAARARAEGEMKTISVACESYRTDNGIYPRNTDTDNLDPRTNSDPTSSVYQAASVFLYSALSGDANANYKADTGEGKNYAGDFFKPNVLSGTKDGSGNLTVIKYIKDPFDNCYGYSTAGAKAEEDYIDQLRTNPKATRPSTPAGFNPTFDLWSTAGITNSSSGQLRWVKNW